MSADGRRFGDLALRAGVGLVLAGLGLLVVVAGSPWFALLVGLMTAVMFWELAAMLGADRRLAALVAAAALIVLAFGWAFGAAAALPGELAAAGLLALVARRLRGAGFVYGLALLAAAHLLVLVREEAGALWAIWLLATTVAADVAAYLGGRAFGGPRFWPRVSPRKTWSGVLCGWCAGGLVALAMAPALGVSGGGLVVLAVIVTLAGQLGDIAESAIKRAVGVKDSSALLPGHGGLLDRFDSLVGATLVFVALMRLGAGVWLGGGP